VVAESVVVPVAAVVIVSPPSVLPVVGLVPPSVDVSDVGPLVAPVLAEVSDAASPGSTMSLLSKQPPELDSTHATRTRFTERA